MIRRRLVVAIILLVTTVSVVAGGLVVGALRDRQVAEIDRQLHAVSAQTDRYLDVLRAADRYPPAFEVLDTHLPFIVRGTAFVVVDADDGIIWSLATGSAEQPDPLPDVAAMPPPGELATVPAVDADGPRFRVLTMAVDDDVRLLIGTPLTAVDETTSSVTEILLVIGGIALAAVAAVAWLIIRRGLRPVDEMVVTAGRIADGDLSQRAPTARGRGEVARLGRALNTMLDRIEQAVAVKVTSESQMRRFVADASHELRTPLTSIRGYAELYRRGASTPDQVAVAFDRIESEARRMSLLVDDLLLLARLDQRRPLDHEPVDVRALATEAVEEARALEPDRPISLAAQDGQVVVAGDSAQLRRAVDNLLANVRAHTGPTTAVQVDLTTDGGQARLVLGDDGPGMSPDQAARAFERFYRAGPDRRGTGLGLAIVADIVRAHGGTIDLDTAPGRGTTVTVSLPLLHVTNGATAANTIPLTRSGISHRRSES